MINYLAVEGQLLLTDLTVDGSSSSELVRITQTGSGNALVVEDSANPDSTPFVVNASGNVGIGTTSPSYPLHISSGTASVDNVAMAVDVLGGNAGDSAGYVMRAANTNELGAIRSYVEGSYLSNMRFFTAGATNVLTERMRINSAGNVGIGTSSPTTKLEVSGSTTISSQNNVAATFGSSASGRLLVGSITGNTPFIGSEGATNLLFTTNATERMRINSSGSVGIGTTSLTGISFRVNKNITGSINSYASIFQGTVQEDVTTQAYAVYASLSKIGAYAPTLTIFAASQGTLTGLTSVTQRGYFADSNLIGAINNYGFQGAIPSGTGCYNLYMNGTAQNYLAGNLGIGVALPTEKLDVAGNIALTGSVVFEGATANEFETTLAVTDPTADRTITLPNASGTVALIAVSDTAPVSPSAGNLWFKSNTGTMYVYYDSFWIEVGSPSAGLDGGSA